MKRRTLKKRQARMERILRIRRKRALGDVRLAYVLMLSRTWSEHWKAFMVKELEDKTE